MDPGTSPLMVAERRPSCCRLRAILRRAAGLLLLVIPPTMPISVAEVAPCNPATSAQAWDLDHPQGPEEGPAPILVRRESGPDGTISATQRIVLPIAQPQSQGPAAEELRPRILWGDPASPFLFLYAVSRDETQPWLHFMVLCRGGDQARVVEHAVLKTDFPLVVDTSSITEAPGTAFAVLIGEGHALLWRSRAPTGQRFKPQLLRWPKPVRALSVSVGEQLRVFALSDDGALHQYAPAQTAVAIGAEPVPGWTGGPVPTSGRIWLRETAGWLYLLTEHGGGRRFELASHRNEPLYGADDGRLVALDWFYSRNGRRTALFLLLAKNASGQTSYHARLYDLGRDLSEPLLEGLPFIDQGTGVEILDQKGNPLPQVFLQDWSANEDFSQIAGFLFHNRSGKGLIDQLQIIPEWDESQWRHLTTLRLRLDQRKETPREILPHQVSVLTDGRRRRVFYFTDTLSYTQAFFDPAELP